MKNTEIQNNAQEGYPWLFKCLSIHLQRNIAIQDFWHYTADPYVRVSDFDKLICIYCL